MRATAYSFGFALAVAAQAVSAQAAPPQAPPASGQQAEVPLKLDREVFAYPSDGRRDPFKPLDGKDAMGPLYEELVVRSIIYSPNSRLSVVNVVDGSKALYRLRVGDIVGNARVVAIEPYRVRLAVSSFGLIREEVLELAQRETVAAARRGQLAPTEADRDMTDAFTEMLRALTGRRDSTAVQPPRQQQSTQTDTTRTRAPIVPRVRGGGTDR